MFEKTVEFISKQSVQKHYTRVIQPQKMSIQKSVQK